MILAPVTILLTLIDARGRFRRVNIMGYEESSAWVVRVRLVLEDGVAVMWFVAGVLLLARVYGGGVWNVVVAGFGFVEA